MSDSPSARIQDMFEEAGKPESNKAVIRNMAKTALQSPNLSPIDTVVLHMTWARATSPEEPAKAAKRYKKAFDLAGEHRLAKERLACGLKLYTLYNQLERPDDVATVRLALFEMGVEKVDDVIQAAVGRAAGFVSTIFGVLRDQAERAEDFFGDAAASRERDDD